MPMYMKALFDGVTEKKTPDGRKIFKAVASSAAMDRHKEVVLPKGIDFSNFIENPVLINQHDHRSSPIGTVISLDVTDDSIPFEFAFDEGDPEAAKLMRKVENGTMRTFSIGFIPTKWMEQDELINTDGTRKDSVSVEVEGDEKYILDLTKYKETPRRVFTKWELLEVSLVSIPANPEAHMMRMAKDLIDEAAEIHPEAKSFIEEEVNDRITSLVKTLKEFEEEINQYEMRGVVASHSTKMVEGAWDGSAARAHLAKWASSDGSGNKEAMSWGKYARGFTWFDSSKSDAFGSYKLPHHDIRGGEFVGVRSGVTAAMAALLGARGGTDVGGDGEACHGHLARHYRDMDMECPEYGKSYSEEELTKIADGTWTKPVEPSGAAAVEPAASPEEPKTPAIDVDTISKLVASIDAFRETLETRAIGFNIKLETILEAVSEMTKAMANRPIVPAEPDPTPGVDDAAKATDTKIVEKLKDALAFYTDSGAGAAQ